LFAFPIAAQEGALIAYGPDYLSLYRKAPFYIDRIVRGTKPADLPVEQPNKVELVINLKTAMTLGLEVPLSLLIRADNAYRVSRSDVGDWHFASRRKGISSCRFRSEADIQRRLSQPSLSRACPAQPKWFHAFRLSGDSI
jgi:hypothetical protein